MASDPHWNRETGGPARGVSGHQAREQRAVSIQGRRAGLGPPDGTSHKPFDCLTGRPQTGQLDDGAERPDTTSGLDS